MSYKLLNGDCLELMKAIPNNSVDLIFTDLPYGQISCKWDCPIDLEKMWIQFLRIKKTNTPIFFTTTTKFGINLINSAPKKCFFRYDLVWVKSSCAGFLNSHRAPLRKHELIYVFYESLPLYDLSSHKHKFKQEYNEYDNKDGPYGVIKSQKGHPCPLYEPPLPTSVIKEHNNHIKDGQIYNGGKAMKVVSDGKGKQYDPPLPTSVIKEDYKKGTIDGNQVYKGKKVLYRNKAGLYDPPLPTSVIKEDLCEYDVNKNVYGGGKQGRIKVPKDKKYHEAKYEPPLPTSVIKEEKYVGTPVMRKNTTYGDIMTPEISERKGGESRYEPPLPTSVLEVKSQRTKHSTQKPVDLMKYIFKYYSKEGDMILDNCMGSGSTGVAAIQMNRDFIGIELDKDIFKVAQDRLKYKQ